MSERETMNKVLEILKQEERSQRWLSRKIGVAPQLITHWINGSEPKMKYKVLIAEVLKTKVKELWR